jgi:hypothetical protein
MNPLYSLPYYVVNIEFKDVFRTLNKNTSMTSPCFHGKEYTRDNRKTVGHVVFYAVQVITEDVRMVSALLSRTLSSLCSVLDARGKLWIC